MEFEYNSERAATADKAADKITEGGPYIGRFKLVNGFRTDNGAEGMRFALNVPGTGSAEFTIYTKSKEGKDTFGVAQVDAMMLLLGLKRLKSERGTVEEWQDDGSGKRQLVETEGDTFPELQDKNIGVVLQLEKYTKQAGGTGERFNLYGLFSADSKLMASEMREGKTTPVKLERLLKGLKVKDSRKAIPEESAQPSMGALPEGGY